MAHRGTPLFSSSVVFCAFLRLVVCQLEAMDKENSASKCACATSTPIYVSEGGIHKCVRAKNLNEACVSNQECSYGNPNVQCVNSFCNCSHPFELTAARLCLLHVSNEPAYSAGDNDGSEAHEEESRRQPRGPHGGSCLRDSSMPPRHPPRFIGRQAAKFARCELDYNELGSSSSSSPMPMLGPKDEQMQRVFDKQQVVVTIETHKRRHVR
ncbi:hypothetical protein HPB52_024215 [Rhipicephalus sanguineus]|uniref:EB domain-containing protein n=1 Tax=Rhipicephalus sanguineus TaxID=34632 RepID=A0A9D4TCQ9_RHISA|nr:hypothetical protein HPB52_024215 [Rhipicephalus sanguineus]